MDNPTIDLTQLAQYNLAGVLLAVLVGWCVIATVLSFMDK